MEITKISRSRRQGILGSRSALGHTSSLLDTNKTGEAATEIRRAENAQVATAQPQDLPLRSQEDAWENTSVNKTLKHFMPITLNTFQLIILKYKIWG